MNIPTSLTLFRIFLIPVVTVLYYLPFQWAHSSAAVCFILACMTDWLDGFLARRLGQTTQLGAFLDPVADKLLITIVLVLLLRQKMVVDIAFPAAVIISREIVISALREWMAELGKRASMAVIFVAKVKTFFQMFALALLLWYYPGSPVFIMWAGVCLLYIAAALTLWSMVVYLKLAWPDFSASC